MNSFVKYNWPSLVWALVILVLCLMPGHDLPSVDIVDFDKFVHFCVYVLLYLLMVYGWNKQDTFPGLHQRTNLKILLITFTYGFAVEIIQELFTADRHFEIFDALANGSGAVGGSIVSRFVYLKKN